MEYSAELFTPMPFCTLYLGLAKMADFVGCTLNSIPRVIVSVVSALTGSALFVTGLVPYF